MIKALGIVFVLIAAAGLEALGDAAVRQGLRGGALAGALILGGGALLLAYAILLARAPFDFGRVIGLYVGIFFVLAQVLNLIVFKTPPSLGIWLGGALIVLGAALTLGLQPR